MNRMNLLRTSLEEELSSISLNIKGTIPNWLSGTLIRNGPAKFESKSHQIKHWFDGLAMLHTFSFIDGNVTYTNRFLRTDAYNQVVKKDSIHYLGFVADPCRSLFKRLFTAFFPSEHPTELQNANVNITKYADSYVALTEAPLPVRFDPNTLETLGVLDYQDRLQKEECWQSAHPHTNEKESISYMVTFGLEGVYIIYRVLANSTKRQIIAEIPVKSPSYMHTFSVTENYIILTEYPFIVNPLDILLKGKGFILNYHWEPNLGTHFHVIRKDSGKIIGRYKTEAFFCFHHINAYEDGEKVILDLVAYDDAKVVLGIGDYGKGNPYYSFSDPSLNRFTLDIKTGNIQKKRITDFSLELPRISSEYDGKPYQYVYGPNLHEFFSMKDHCSLYKIDVESGEALQWFEDGCYPGEAVFISYPDSQSEDGGVVMSLVLDENSARSFLLILDAQTFKEIGRAEVPHHIPAGLHGQYYE